MARKIIDIGTVGNDGTGDSIRDSFRKVNDNFRELYASLGLGEKLTFLGLSDTPDSFVEALDQGKTAVLTVNNTADGLVFKQIAAGQGISIDFESNADQIEIINNFDKIARDTNPILGGDLRTKSGGGQQFRILDLPEYNRNSRSEPGGPRTASEAVSKSYVDSFVSLKGVDHIDPGLGVPAPNPAFGTMTGPLVLSRDPVADDDLKYNGLIAATKRYVDGSTFGSTTNLYVSSSGEDSRPTVSDNLQGASLSYSYRTLETALRRAEELMLESKVELGPYKKVLTYGDDPNNKCTLAKITQAQGDGAGFTSTVVMTADTITLITPGVNYYEGDIITISGGTPVGGDDARIKISVVSTASRPGEITSFRVVSGGLYSALPPTVDDAVTGTTISQVLNTGTGATFKITYKVSRITVTNTGSGYGLVSVRISDTKGNRAFGTADVVDGAIVSITVTDPGTGFKEVPSCVADLPRFLIFTNGRRTDATGITGDPDIDSTAANRKKRDIREGLYIRGETSGALAQVLSHSGQLGDFDGVPADDQQSPDLVNAVYNQRDLWEIFDVDIKVGAFIEGEVVSYGDISRNKQISVLVESGTYEEDLPLKVPQNVAIIGDEFRRVIIRPRTTVSSSPWAFQKFRRDLTVGSESADLAENDTLDIARQIYGYHYLRDPGIPVYPKISNRGDYVAASALLRLNKDFIAEEVVAYVNWEINDNLARQFPWTANFEYNESLCKRDVGYLVDAMIFDLRWGGYNRTVSAALKYQRNASSLKAITDQLEQTAAAIEYIRLIAKDILSNEQYPSASSQLLGRTTVYNTVVSQIVDKAYSAETGTSAIVDNFIDAVIDIIRDTANTLPGGIVAGVDYYVSATGLSSSTFKVSSSLGGAVVQSTSLGSGSFHYRKVKDPSSRAACTMTATVGQDIVVAATNHGLTAGTVVRFNTTVNYPKNSDEMDMFLCNDANILRAMSSQGHGGFMMVLDPEGQILAKSPYAQECASFAKSINKQTFAGGMYVDGFAGNLQFKHKPNAEFTGSVSGTTLTVTVVSRGVLAAGQLIFTAGATNTVSNATKIVSQITPLLAGESLGGKGRYTVNNSQSISSTAMVSSDPVGLEIEGLDRFPQLPSSFLINDVVYRINYVRNYIYNTNGSTGTLVLDEDNQFTAIPGSQICTISNSSPAIITRSNHGLQPGAIVVFATSGTLPTGIEAGIEYYVLSEGLGDSVFRITAVAGSNVPVNSTSSGSGTHRYQRTYEILAPGNRSMLGNDFTQINDLGYGLVAINGGLIEAVSVFTYYAHISYYSVNGGQIRSVGGSSAHGNYALVAQGADPLEVPTPTSLYEELAQGVTCYRPSVDYDNEQGGFLIWVDGYNYTPIPQSELEIDHDGNIVRYVVSGVSTDPLLPGKARLTISTADGLVADVADNVKMTLRADQRFVLTGNLITKSTRPSTGLVFNEDRDKSQTVICTISKESVTNRAIITAQQHGLKKGYTVEFALNNPQPGDSLPSGISSATTYYILSTDLTLNTFKISLEPDGTPVVLTTLGQGVFTYTPTNIIKKNQKVYRVLNFDEYEDPNGPYTCTISNGSPAVVSTATAHRLRSGYTVRFQVAGGTLPSGLEEDKDYFVIDNDENTLSNLTFGVSLIKGGSPIATTSAGSGTFTYTVSGLTSTKVSQNYDYIEIKPYKPNDYVSGWPKTVSLPGAVSNSSGLTITLNSHGLNNGDVIKVGISSGGTLPGGLRSDQHYFVRDANANNFKLSASKGGNAVAYDTSGSGTLSFGLVKGRAGDDTFAIETLGTRDSQKIVGYKFVWKGEEYTVTNYLAPGQTGGLFGRIVLNRALVDSVINYTAIPTLKAGVPARIVDSDGAISIRISLTRVTGHDLLNIGTGSYADTNYPNEIYGAPVNEPNPDQETQERGLGRVFYVTTDQFGNFNVGPFFSVDQGTGNVTFAASIAISQLSGLGFKDGVTVSEFSTDTALTDGSPNKVPTEFATKIYIERRLGIKDDGSLVADGNLIPATIGGFLPLNGSRPMRGILDLDNKKIINLADAAVDTDAVNKRSLVMSNFSEFSSVGSTPSSGQLLSFTGSGKGVINATVGGDISLVRSGNTLTANITSGVIVNADINASAAIDQSKLSLTAATTRANATAITQADRGIASFDSAQFTATSGWITVKNNGLTLDKLQAIANSTVLGNYSGTTGNVTAVPFSTIVDTGNSVKKVQYTSTGFLRRINVTDNINDSSYAIVDMSSTWTAGDPQRLMVRAVDGSFTAGTATLTSLNISTDSVITRTTGATGGVVNHRGFQGTGGLEAGWGSTSADQTNIYRNTNHEFRNTSNALAPIKAVSTEIGTLIAAGGTTTSAGTIRGYWSLETGSRLQATYSADLAEYYEGDREYEVGTVLIFGGDKEVTVTTTEADTRVAGVVSDNAAFTMYDACPGIKTLVALQGRVPVRAVGKISKGDLMVTSKIPGVAVSARDSARAGTIVGKALQDYDSDHIGLVEVAVGRN